MTKNKVMFEHNNRNNFNKDVPRYKVRNFEYNTSDSFPRFTVRNHEYDNSNSFFKMLSDDCFDAQRFKVQNDFHIQWRRQCRRGE